MNLATPDQRLADKASATADQAIRGTQRAANSALDSLADGAQDLRERAGPVIERAAATSSEYAHRGLDAVRDSASAVRDKAQRASDGTVTYIREEPVKSLLIAVAVGVVVALLMGRRSRDD